MKRLRRSILVAPCTLLATLAHGQLQVGSRLEFDAYLQYEPVAVVTAVRNEQGTPLVFNIKEDDPRFYYVVRNADGMEMTPLSGMEMPQPEMIPARSGEIMTNNLLRLFAAHTPGYYSVQPCIDWRGKTYRGEKRHFEVVAGLEVGRASASIADGSSRLFRLYHINRNRQDHLLLRIDDEEAHLCYGVFPLGRTIISHRRELVVDVSGSVHVLHATAPRTMVHATFSPMGHMIGRKVFGQDFVDVGLKVDGTGNVSASGIPAASQPERFPMPQSILDREE